MCGPRRTEIAGREGPDRRRAHRLNQESATGRVHEVSDRIRAERIVEATRDIIVTESPLQSSERARKPMTAEPAHVIQLDAPTIRHPFLVWRR